MFKIDPGPFRETVNGYDLLLFSQRHEDTETESELSMNGSSDAILHQCLAKIQ